MGYHRPCGSGGPGENRCDRIKLSLSLLQEAEP